MILKHIYFITAIKQSICSSFILNDEVCRTRMPTKKYNSDLKIQKLLENVQNAFDAYGALRLRY